MCKLSRGTGEEEGEGAIFHLRVCVHFNLIKLREQRISPETSCKRRKLIFEINLHVLHDITSQGRSWKGVKKGKFETRQKCAGKEEEIE